MILPFSNITEHWWWMNECIQCIGGWKLWGENCSTPRETWPTGILSTTQHMWTSLGLSLGLFCERPLHNHLSRGLVSIPLVHLHYNLFALKPQILCYNFDVSVRLHLYSSWEIPTLLWGFYIGSSLKTSSLITMFLDWDHSSTCCCWEWQLYHTHKASICCDILWQLPCSVTGVREREGGGGSQSNDEQPAIHHRYICGLWVFRHI